MTECDTDTPMEHVILQEDAVSSLMQFHLLVEKFSERSSNRCFSPNP